MSARVKDGESEKVGRVPGDFLKRYHCVNEDSQVDFDSTDDGGRVSFEALVGGIADSAMLYMAIESYRTEDPNHINLEEGTQLVVLEICEDGKQLPSN